jgi:alkanesulfonate monooxygenase SsuD/methylene tetrahydromethanopterin reductase-like flavin-dependent oxidoreductase (luciferase family)
MRTNSKARVDRGFAINAFLQAVISLSFSIKQGQPMPSLSPHFGIWALVHGSRAALQDPDEPYDASWSRNRELVLEAERLGYYSTLVAQQPINPHDATLDQMEAWTASAALAALTSRIEIITAVKPYLYHPVVLAKMAMQIEDITGGRFAINWINAWNRPELAKARHRLRRARRTICLRPGMDHDRARPNAREAYPG